MSPSGVEFNGVEISLGGITDPASIVRTYDDIERILHQNKTPYKITETKTDAGTFKSYLVSS